MAQKAKRKKKKRRTTSSWKKKEWYTVVAPKEFDSKEVANTPATKPELLQDRVIKVPLRDLTGKMSHQTKKVLFKVKEVKGKTAHTQTAGFEMVNEQLKRNVRRGRSMVKLVGEFDSKNGETAKITAHAFLVSRVNTSKKDQIRNLMADSLQKRAKEMVLNDLFRKSLFGELPIQVKKDVRAICPVRRVVINKFKVLGV